MGRDPSLAGARAGGARELLGLAWPLIVSNSIWTLQITLDRALLSRSGSQSVAAGMASAMIFWTFLSLFQNTANYATTFVAQYTGAGRHEQVGPVVWQALYFAAGSGLAFLGLIPLAERLVGLSGHSGTLQGLEITYFRMLCLSGLPMLVTAAATSFFAGRGDSRTVLFVNAAGLVINGLAAYAWIFGRWGFPAWGIAGAGAATVLGTSTTAILSLVLFFMPRFRWRYGTVAGWRPDSALLRRLLHFGLPNGIFAFLDCLAYTVFLLFIGRLGEVELAATSIAFTINLVAVLPIFGIGQAVEVLVGQRLGAEQPDVAARTTWTAWQWALAFTGAVALAYALIPGIIVEPFRSDADAATWEQVRERLPALLRFVALYALFDTTNMILSFALRGAGDTRFVTWVAVGLAWPVLVLPAWVAWSCGGGLNLAWGFLTLYVVLLGFVFLFRFRQGKWRGMRVIAPAPAG
jgi:MATE family multidrug resistance protein